jgi:hypothetical protein
VILVKDPCFIKSPQVSVLDLIPVWSLAMYVLQAFDNFCRLVFDSHLSNSQLKYQSDCFTEMSIIHSFSNPMPHLLSTLLMIESN